MTACTRFTKFVGFAWFVSVTMLPGIAQAGPQVAGDTYVYQAAGRRDPFVNLMGTGVEPRVSSKRGDGPAGILVNEIALRAVMQSGRTLIAMIQGPDGKSHIIHVGDKFMDGTVKTITPQGLVLEQDVNDPLSLEKRRDVRKSLRSAEDTTR